jgi:hypothetical protein
MVIRNNLDKASVRLLTPPEVLSSIQLRTWLCNDWPSWKSRCHSLLPNGFPSNPSHFQKLHSSSLSRAPMSPSLLQTAAGQAAGPSFQCFVNQLPVTVTNTQDNQLRKRKALFGLTVWRFQSKIACPLCFGAYGKVAHTARVCGRDKMLTSWPGSKRSEEKCAHSTVPFKGTLTMS